MVDEEQKKPVDEKIAAQEGPAATPPPTGGDDEVIDFDPDDVDRVLAEEDPEFAEELKEIQNAEFKTDVAIASVDIEAFLKEGETIKTKQAEEERPSLKERVQAGYAHYHARISKIIDDFQNAGLKTFQVAGHFLLKIIKQIFKYSLGAIATFLKFLLNLPTRIKLQILSVMLLLGASALSIVMSLKGHFLPQMRHEYITGFTEYADETFEYKATERRESFESANRHPEHMFEFEKVVVNLKDPQGGEHLPMGLFEFYIEMNSQEATVEMSERKTEAKHIIERVLEQLTYKELISQHGKNKLKFIVRKELNDFLSKTHHVRQVYIKTFVLKP